MFDVGTIGLIVYIIVLMLVLSARCWHRWYVFCIIGWILYYWFEFGTLGFEFGTIGWLGVLLVGCVLLLVGFQYCWFDVGGVGLVLYYLFDFLHDQFDLGVIGWMLVLFDYGLGVDTIGLIFVLFVWSW